MRQPHRNRQGFTLIELIVVLAVTGILAAMAVSAPKVHVTRAKEAVLRTNLWTIRDVLDRYHGDKGYYPPTLEVLVDDGHLRKVPSDPMTRPSATWTLVYEEFDPEALPPRPSFPRAASPASSTCARDRIC